MDRTDAPTAFPTLPLFKMRKAFSKARARATADRQTNCTSVPSSSIASLTPVLSRLPASTQNLPTEIVLNILTYALPTIYDKALSFRSDPHALYNELTSGFRKVLVDTQLCLRCAALVCRAWYAAANELLYACPFLGSSNSVLSFSRALRSRLALGKLVHEIWVFNEEGVKHSDLIGIKRKITRRVQADFMSTLRTLTSLNSIIVCNHGLIEHEQFPIDNILIYAFPATPQDPFVPKLSVYGPSTFNTPWTRHAKPSNLLPSQLEHLCVRDIEISPAEVKCAPYFPTLPRLQTLQIAMFHHNELPVVSAGTFPTLRHLEVYRDMFDSRSRAQMRVVAVDERCLQQLETLILVGRVAESLLFRSWAAQLLFTELKHLTIGLLHPNEHEFISEWRLPDHLETLEVVVWHNAKPMKLELGEMGDAQGTLRALYACLHRNRQSRSFKKLVIRATSSLPNKLFSPLVDQLKELCDKQEFALELYEGGLQKWVEARLSGCI